MSLSSDRPESQSTQPITSPCNPAKWESAVVVPKSTKESDVGSRNELITTAKSSSFSTHTPPETAPRTVKTDSTMFSTMCHTNSTQLETLRSRSHVTNPFSVSSRTHVNYPGLKLSQRSVELIKNDFERRRSAESLPFGHQEIEMIATVEIYHQNLSSSLQDCGEYLDAMIGCRNVFINDAMKALEQLVNMDIITEQEVALSADCEEIANSSANDVISIRSLSNVVRKILLDRDMKQIKKRTVK